MVASTRDSAYVQFERLKIVLFFALVDCFVFGLVRRATRVLFGFLLEAIGRCAFVSIYFTDLFFVTGYCHKTTGRLGLSEEEASWYESKAIWVYDSRHGFADAIYYVVLSSVFVFVLFWSAKTQFSRK